MYILVSCSFDVGTSGISIGIAVAWMIVSGANVVLV